MMSRHLQPEALVAGVTNMSEDEEPAAAAGSITQDEREENALYGFKRRIEACFNNAGHAWLEAVRVLETAERILSPRDFSSLREEFKWHYSTVRKFIKIALDPFLQRHEAKLACVDSWSVLHEITKLDEAGRDLFEAEYLSGRAARYITRRQVQECRTVKPQQANRRRSVQRKQTNSGLVLATIEVDSELSESDLEELFSRNLDDRRAPLSKVSGGAHGDIQIAPLS
jgi:hypothetical protein